MSETALSKLEKRVKELEEKNVEFVVLMQRLLGSQESLMEQQHQNFAARIREKGR